MLIFCVLMIKSSQPAGVGFSTVTNDSFLPYTLKETAEDFSVFLSLFCESFPHLSELPLHLAGESFGGHYVPAIVQHVIRSHSQPSKNPNVFRGHFDSIILANAFVDPVSSLLGSYEFLCTSSPEATGVEGPVLNATSCGAIAEAYPVCETLGKLCTKTYIGPICRAANETCQEMIGKYFPITEGRRNPFDSTFLSLLSSLSPTTL